MELDRYAEQEFPVGSQVVVTHSGPQMGCQRGEVLTVESSAFIWWAGLNDPIFGREMDPADTSFNGMKCQILKMGAMGLVAHPVAWLRKLEDPDGEAFSHQQRRVVPA